MAMALMHNHLHPLSLDLDWTMHPEKMCETIVQTKKKLISEGHIIEGFAGTGLGSLFALLLAAAPNQRWLALDVPTKPGEYFTSAAASLGMSWPDDELNAILKWYEMAETRMMERISKFLNPNLKNPMKSLGDSIIAMTKDNADFKNWLYDRNYKYTLLENEDSRFGELVSLMF